MSNTYSELYYHFIWSTKDRLPLITAEVESRLFGFIRHKCEELRVVVHAVNVMPNHVHLACSLPRQLSVSEFMEALKGSSSHFINHLPTTDGRLYWQEGYGVLTFSKRDLPQIVGYIDKQKFHHQAGQLSLTMERTSDKPQPRFSGGSCPKGE